jgi:hypothetical protein
VQHIVKDDLRKDVTTRDADHINLTHLLVKGKQQEAKAGAQSAVAALKEATGLGPEIPLVLAGEQVVELALMHLPNSSKPRSPPKSLPWK